MAQHSLCILTDPPLSGPENMARDEALLAGVGDGTTPPTLRFYRWDPPTISLGYFQPYAAFAALPPPEGLLAVVRRPTGGGAILHDKELTYALALPNEHALLREGAHQLYAFVHEALIAVIAAQRGGAFQLAGENDGSGAARGPFFCFARRHELDVVVGGEKLAGSAQRRTPGGVLQHGSIVLQRRFEAQPAAELASFGDWDPATLAARLVDRLAETHGLIVEQRCWTERELTTAAAQVERFAGDAWTRRV
jgi:lipoate-protein ligase A